jgi:hypothetical protein
MNGWKVLLILHCVGWGFCTLWVLGTCWKERMWGNAITCINWCQAFIVSLLGLGLVARFVIYVLGQPQSSDDAFTVLASTTAIGWILFIAVFGGLKSWTDKLSPVRVAFHPVFDGLGNLFFCLALAGLIVLSTVPMFLIVLGGLAASTGGAELPPEQAALKGTGGSLPWQAATMFCGYWVLVAVAVAVLSKPSGRLEQPKKIEANT